jgi:hypothetical protein
MTEAARKVLDSCRGADGGRVNAAGWAELVIAVVLVAGLPAVYALRRAATVPGLITSAVVTFGVFSVWFLLSVSYVRELSGAFGAAVGSWWPVIAVMVGMAGADVACCWFGWRWHLRLYPSKPHGEQAHPVDGMNL